MRPKPYSNMNNWHQVVSAAIGTLPAIFSLSELYSALGFNTRDHDDSRRAGLRHVLQQFRDEQRLRFLGNGTYRKSGVFQ